MVIETLIFLRRLSIAVDVKFSKVNIEMSGAKDDLMKAVQLVQNDFVSKVCYDTLNVTEPGTVKL